MISKRGKMITTEGTELQDRNIADVQERYNYLGIPQANGTHEEDTRKSATAIYQRKISLEKLEQDSCHQQLWPVYEQISC